MTAAAARPPLLQNRLGSLDQFRGYTVAGMFLVNYLGSFAACPYILRHHNNFCSYADTIMPQFFFAVGFSLRLSFGRRVVEEGLGRAYWHVVKRLLGLALVAIVVYRGSPSLDGHPFNWETIKSLHWHIFYAPFKRDWFQTLLHIAVTSLWILPVIRLRPTWRIVYMIASAALHLGLSSYFYFDWVNTSPGSIDGGPLGFLTWTIPTMVGTLACDVVMSPRSRGRNVAMLFGWGIVLMALGWIASAGTRMYDGAEPSARDPKFAANPVIPTRAQLDEWYGNLKAGRIEKVRAEYPFIPPPGSGGKDDLSYEQRRWNYWMMSQRNGTISYLAFGAGLSLAVYGLFYVLSDMGRVRVGVFRTLGSNALFGYVLHGMVGDAVEKFVPKDVPAPMMWASFALFFFICWLILRSLEKKNIFIKL